MKDKVLLWYNAPLELYFVGDEHALSFDIEKYHETDIDVLYTMESNQLALCEKIKDRLNNARELSTVM